MRYTNTLFTMTGFLGGFLIAGTVSGADLQVGDVVPHFKCLDDHGQIWDSREHVGKKMLVVYFYRSDFAFCCTRQAARYRDNQRGLTNQNVEVVGVSGDVVAAHAIFRETHRLNHALLADFEGNVAHTFGVPLGAGGKAMVRDVDGKEIVDGDGAPITIRRDLTPERWTFVIDRDGRVIYRETNVSPKKDSEDVLDFLCEWTAKPPMPIKLPMPAK